jgi:hypothetical protein
MYDRLVKAIKRVRSDIKDEDELLKALRDLRLELTDGLVKYNSHGQWSMAKTETSSNPYHLSNKWSGKQIPENHPDRKTMVNHINTMNQAGSHAEARRLYDQHISGGGAYTKDKVDKADRSKWIKPEKTTSTEDKIAQVKWDHGTKVDDPGETNTKLESKRFARAKKLKGP